MRLLVALVLALIVGCFAACPGQTDAQVRAAREAFFKLWGEKTNVDWFLYRDVTDLYWDESVKLTYVSVGTFAPKPIAQEYGRIVWNAEGTYENSFFKLLNQYLGPSLNWISTDVASFRFLTNLTIDYTTVGGGILQVDGLSNYEELTFVPCSTKILVDYNELDPVFIQVLQTLAATVPSDAICGLIQFACPPGSQHQQYPTFGDCLNFITSIPAISDCPFAQTSNTTNCRFLHAQNALYLPQIHCVHTAVNSPVCKDDCFPACDGCDANARCVVESVIHGVISYECRCNSGYKDIGNAKVGHCVAVTCSNGGQWQCPGDYNAALCPSGGGNCGCQPTFEWNPAGNGACVCPPEHYVNWFNGKKECIPLGRCREQYQCAQTLGINYNWVRCTDFGVNPALAPGVKSCVCNPGFDGDINVACACAAGKQVKWSSALSASVCLASGECTDNAHCAQGKQCVDAHSIGHCA